MKSIEELFQELGFKKDGNEATQKAFINHLIKTASVNKSQSQKAAESPEEAPQKQPIQLAFDLGEAS